MSYKEANEMFPVWASAEAVRIVDEPTEKDPLPLKHRLTDKQERFMKRYAFAIGFIFALAVYSVLICVITGTIVKRNTEQEMAVKYAEELQAYKDAEMGRRIVTGDESKAAAMKADAREIAKAFYGIRNFINVYHYTEKDLRTYARCIFNRADAKGKSVQEIVSADNQFTGFSEDHPVLDEYYNLALIFVDKWYHEDTKPMGIDFQWAELTDKGIFLVNEFNASGYVPRLQED